VTEPVLAHHAYPKGHALWKPPPYLTSAYGETVPAPLTHTRTKSIGISPTDIIGPDHCHECSTAVSAWVTWPCDYAQVRDSQSSAV
jgi:hypothetical protein